MTIDRASTEKHRQDLLEARKEIAVCEGEIKALRAQRDEARAEIERFKTRSDREVQESCWPNGLAAPLTLGESVRLESEISLRQFLANLPSGSSVTFTRA